MRRFIVIVSIAVAVITFSIVHNSYSGDRCDHTCSKCHQITNQEAINLLKDTAPDVKILEIRPSEVKGLWEIDLESKGQKGIIYVDFSKKYVVSGSIIDIKTKANVTQDRFSAINKVEVSQIPLDDTLVMGDKEAKYRVIVFTDPD